MASSIRVLLRTDESADQEILELVHLAFEERKTQGLNFTCINYTIDDIKKKAEGAFVFLDGRHPRRGCQGTVVWRSAACGGADVLRLAGGCHNS